VGPRSIELSDVILKIHSAALAENGWDIVVKDLCQAFKARGAAFIRPALNPSASPSAAVYEFDVSALKTYSEHWGVHDVWYRGAVRNGRTAVGQVNLDDQLINHREFARSPFFNEFLKQHDIDRMMNVCLAGPGDAHGPVSMNFYRGLGKAAFSSDEFRLFCALGPHLRIAVQTHWSAQALRVRQAAYAQAVDAVSSALFGIESTLRISFLNRAAEDEVRQKRWIQIANHLLAPGNSLIDVRPLAKALRGLASGLAFRLMVTHGETGEQAIVSGAPVAPAEPGVAGIAALVWLTPVVPAADAVTDLARLFGLTSAEQRLIGQLVAGNDLREVASSLHISLHTARTHLKAIFGKTGLRSQSALLSFTARLSALRAHD
jgi:DNA-binding CsgD family transcriptional regulator